MISGTPFCRAMYEVGQDLRMRLGPGFHVHLDRQA
jgi:hypothetical protein